MGFRGGALLIDKPAGISSFGVIEALQRALMTTLGVKKKELPSFGHGGTLDPFATGLLVVCFGDAVKLTRYFLDSEKGYSGVIRFGVTTRPGDPTEAVSETSSTTPETLDGLRCEAQRMCDRPYLQTPPMFSAKKIAGQTLYELARRGLEVERAAREVKLFRFEISSYERPDATFAVTCSSGTYIRTLAQDLAQRFDTIAMLMSLRRTHSGSLSIQNALPLVELTQAIQNGSQLSELPCFVPFDDLLKFDSLGIARLDITREEAVCLIQGRQEVLKTLALRGPSQHARVALFERGQLVAVAHAGASWQIERVFPC